MNDNGARKTLRDMHARRASAQKGVCPECGSPVRKISAQEYFGKRPSIQALEEMKVYRGCVNCEFKCCV